jgi:ADP-ribose pyrophosphatase YjhB (NUDIX family)
MEETEVTDVIKAIRNSAKAVIVRDGKVLLTKNEDKNGYFYLFPGGGQEPGEELKDAVVRECNEEIGQEVEVGELIHVREYIGRNHQFAEWDAHIHQVEFYFECRLVEDGPEPVMNGTLPDQAQVGVEWIALEQLEAIRLYPGRLGLKLAGLQKYGSYLGDCN